MALRLVYFSIIAGVFFLIFPSALSKNHHGHIRWWCNKTPNPEPCKYFLYHSRHRFAVKHKTEFRKVVVQIALEKALNVQRHALQFGQNCKNKQQKAAWNDCSKLYNDTVSQLNRTLEGLGKNWECTDFDAQTWLSTALTNIATCRAGSLELNVWDFILPIASNNNVSELISNALAINSQLLDLKKENQNQNQNHTDNDDLGKFPTWVSYRERKLLQASSVKANLIVAKDGSGRFRTVQAAIDAAARRRRSSRFVIYIKKGIYWENIEVGNNNNNIMLIGDGIKNTIITARRSVSGGSTTYNSATAGTRSPPPSLKKEKKNCIYYIGDIFLFEMVTIGPRYKFGKNT